MAKTFPKILDKSIGGQNPPMFAFAFRNKELEAYTAEGGKPNQTSSKSASNKSVLFIQGLF
jgi:hypothetical protein